MQLQPANIVALSREERRNAWRSKGLAIYESDLVERSCDGGEEGGGLQGVGGRVRFGASAEDDDDKLLGGVDVEVLAEDADRLERAFMKGIACGDGPPEVAVVHGFTTDDVSGAGFAEPAFGDD